MERIVWLIEWSGAVPFYVKELSRNSDGLVPVTAIASEAIAFETKEQAERVIVFGKLTNVRAVQHGFI